MHQGWVETYLGAVPEASVADGRHCLAGAPAKQVRGVNCRALRVPARTRRA